jgi:hypothetical protein
MKNISYILSYSVGNIMNDNYNLSSIDLNKDRLISNLLYYFHLRGINISYLINFEENSIGHIGKDDIDLIDFNNNQLKIRNIFILDPNCILYSEYGYVKLNFDEFVNRINKEYDCSDEFELIQELKDNFFYEFLKFGDFYFLFDSSNFTLFLKKCESLFNYVLTTCNYDKKQFKIYGSDMYDLIEFSDPDQFNIEINVINYLINELRLLINK